MKNFLMTILPSLPNNFKKTYKVGFALRRIKLEYRGFQMLGVFNVLGLTTEILV